MDIKQQTKNVASQGRYGDSMLLHVNPAEVKGLAQALPITINPQTGQPEAFLPFLAPLLGSTLASSLAASGVLGATLAASPALAAGLGAGLATYAQTGGSGSKALLSGLTAGFGTNAANTAAQAATTDAATQAAVASGTLPAQAATDAAMQAAVNPRVATGPLTALKDTFAGGFDQGATALTEGLMSPSGFAAIGTAGTQGIMQSQEEFEAMLARNAREQEEERQRIIAENPEMIPIATGGVTKMQRGGDTNRGASEYNEIQNAVDGYYGGSLGGGGFGGGGGYDVGSYTGTGYARKREAVPIDPYFMPGFQGEATYFTNLNPSATDIIGGNTPGTGEQVPSTTASRRFNPTQTVGYQNFYGDQAQDIVPQVVDPYAPVQFESPPPPVLNQPAPFPIMPIEGTPIPDRPDGRNFSIQRLDDLPNEIQGEPTPKAIAQPTIPEESVDVANFVSPNLQNMPPLDFSNLSAVDLSNLNIPTDLPELDILNDRMARRSIENRDLDFRAEGKQLKPVPEGNKGLAKLPDDVRNTMGFMQAGGPTEIMQDPLTAQLIQFLMGEVQDDTIVGDFINKYGNEVFMQVREQVLQSIVPGSQTQGQIQGMANGGMQDDVTGMIGSTQPVAVSQDEYIIPADAMSMLGDGSSDAGAKKLDAMLDRIRMTKTGTTKQAKEIDDSKVMPA